ncbi:hypothetical protein [Pandoraea norimbergensis]|uniref:Uncharacterized protein n=1 Tax=Pandoraea norimbergensis TaxID=93219 RepID=A0ABN4JKI0_9BURK|nr:hypothetical protein [Pandoraea norimbergensis]ALS60772.1 hypothetical protein AT302_14295 [Pandoraea norimbergensis]
MTDRPFREDYQRWLDAQPPNARLAQEAPGTATPGTATVREPPASLPFGGYVVWFHESDTYLDIRFDHHRFEIVTQQVADAREAFIFESFDAAYGHALDVGEHCLILFAEAEGMPVNVVG